MKTTLKQVKLGILFCLIFGFDAMASKQLHFREGMVFGSYDGVISNEMSNPTLLDLELEDFIADRKAWFLNTTIAQNFEENVVEYAFIGGGMNYYATKGMLIQTFKDSWGLESIPAIKLYAGWHAGFSFIVLDKIGTFLRINSWGYDVGVHGGIGKQLTKKIGAEFRLSYDVTTGFTTVAVGGWTAKALLGLTYYF